MDMVTHTEGGQALLHDKATLRDRVTGLPPLLEIKTRPTSDWVKVTPNIFRSWSGSRRLDGRDYVGPVYYYLTNNKV